MENVHIAIIGEGRVSTDKVSIIIREIGAIKANPRLHKHRRKGDMRVAPHTS